MTIRLKAVADRRADNRLVSPICPQCSNDRPMVGIIRTTRFVYFRCLSCGDVQPKVMPSLPLAHGLVARLSD